MTGGLPNRTLVVAPNWVGDTVMAWPVLEALAASGRSLRVLAKPHLHALLGLSPAVGGLLTRQANDTETVAAVRSASCGEAVVLPNSFHSAWIPARAGVPVRWGYPGGFRRPLLRPAVRRRGGSGHQVEDYARLLEAMGVPLPASWEPRLELGAEGAAAGERLLTRAGVGGDPILGLFPGAAFGPSKRWPLGRFVELSNELRRRHPSARQVVVAGPSELWIAVRLYERTGKIHPVVGPDLDLAELAAVLSRLDLLVTNDSGPMHLAAALGVPCVALFGPTDPDRTRPLGAGHEVLYTDRWCSPCFRRRCPLLHHRCLRQIDAASVADRCLATLGA